MFKYLSYALLSSAPAIGDISASLIMTFDTDRLMPNTQKVSSLFTGSRASTSVLPLTTI
jgi:hypothetical protein